MMRGKLGWAAAMCVLAVGTTANAEAQVVPPGRPLHGLANLDRGFVPDPQIMHGVMGGSVPANQYNPSCRGRINPQPSHIIRTRSGFQSLRFVVNGQGDSTLMVMLPNGVVLCDDDGGEGQNPLIQTSSPPGDIRVWVGVYSDADQGRPYTIGITELVHVTASHIARPGPVATPAAVVNPNAPPAFGTVSLRPGFVPDPHVVTGHAGGPVGASNLDPQCRGFITVQPSHTVLSSAGFRTLRVLVNSGEVDTTLVVMAPNGQVFCNDDGGGDSGLNPVVELSTGPGPIRIWVGTYSSGASAPYHIGFTELPHISMRDIVPGALVPGPRPRPGAIAMPVQSDVVTMQLSIPVTLMGPGLDEGTVALWRPAGGPPTQVTMRGRTLFAGGTVLASLPPSMAEPVVTVTQVRNGAMVVRAEQAPVRPRDGGETFILLVTWQGGPTIAERWTGRFGQRGPRWAR